MVQETERRARAPLDHQRAPRTGAPEEQALDEVAGSCTSLSQRDVLAGGRDEARRRVDQSRRRHPRASSVDAGGEPPLRATPGGWPYLGLS